MDALLRTIITPSKQKITIELPEDYIGKKVEILAFPIEESDVLKNIHDPVLTHFVSEATLSKDWLTTEEDIAWSAL
jgi:hypothetical protein